MNSCLSVRTSVRPSGFFSVTVHRIFLIFGMKVQLFMAKKLTEPDFWFWKKWGKCQKLAKNVFIFIFGKILSIDVYFLCLKWAVVLEKSAIFEYVLLVTDLVFIFSSDSGWSKLLVFQISDILIQRFWCYDPKSTKFGPKIGHSAPFLGMFCSSHTKFLFIHLTQDGLNYWYTKFRTFWPNGSCTMIQKVPNLVPN